MRTISMHGIMMMLDMRGGTTRLSRARRLNASLVSARRTDWSLE